MAIIYKITNLIDGKIYIGATRFSIEKRWSEHRYSSKLTKNRYLYNAIRKHGIDNFKIEQVASCLDGYWSECEKLVIESMSPEYNMTNGGEITVGRSMTKEVAAKIGRSNTGKVRSEEQKIRDSEIKKEYNKIPENKAKTLAALEIARKNRNEEVRVASLRKAGAEGRMTRSLSDEHLKKMLKASQALEIRKKVALSKQKKVECTTLNTVFDSVSEAAEALGLSISGVSCVCRGKRNSAYGLKFSFID